MDSNEKIKTGYQDFEEKILDLEKRLSKLESLLRNKSTFINAPEAEDKEILPIPVQDSEEGQIESNIGGYGLAWLGNFVLFFGIIFLAEYLHTSGFKLISPLLGFAAVAGIFGLARYFRGSNSYMARIFNLNGYLLAFYISLKLHFFTADPLIAHKATGLIPLIIISGVLLYLSYRQKYTLLAGLSLILLAVTAIVSDSTHLMLSMATVISILGLVFLYRFGWIYQVFISISLVYLINFLWLIGNPFMGHPVQIITNYLSGFNYLFLVSAIFSLIALMPVKEESYSSDSITGSIIYNGIGFVFMMTMYILSFFKDNYILPAASISLYCILYSVILKVKTNWKITGAIYALFGFVALSLTIIGIYGFPKAWFLLSLQSLLVVSMAIWFRSRFIVIMNSLMYIMLLCIYLMTSDSGDAINISFTFVAFATARILNWQKERLSIRTDFIRNVYLVILFVMVLFTLYHLIPKQYITLSWTLAAVVYFMMSLLLKNVKYRYMALGNMISAALHLFIADLVRIEMVYRVIALLFLAFISIAISFYYFKLKRKTEK